MSTPPEIIYNFSHTRSDLRVGKPAEPTRQDIEWLFTVLYDTYGPRNWWPTVHGGAFELVIGAILVQNISWSNVERALINLREADVWSFRAILESPDEEMHVLIRPSGYYKAKTRKLKEFATFIVECHHGDLESLFALPIDEMRAQLLSVWGIGEETADDIILYGAKKPSFVIDAYTKRLLARLGWEIEGKSYSAYQQLFHQLLPHDAQLFNEYHALIDYHVARICKKKPLCDKCAFADQCPVGRGVSQP